MIFRKCVDQGGIAERKKMINRSRDLPAARQYKALQLHRTTIYREPTPVKQEYLDLMKLFNGIHKER